MNKTISINIAGFVFNIEEQAYELLSQYLTSIKLNFKKEPDCEEIMADIEARIAELFHEKISTIKEVVTEADVEEVITVMGKPEDYVSEETADNFTAEEEEKAEYVHAEEVGGNYRGTGRTKRLYRDEKNGSIGGVCEGLGWFFGLDPVLIRAGFVVLTILGGSGILLYIVLWIVIPEAKTTAEILEMQGQPVNLDNIKEHFRGMKSKVDKSTGQVKSKIKRTVKTSRHAGSKLVQSLTRLLGILLVVGGVFALLVLIIILFGDTGLLPLVGTEQVENLPTLLGVLYPDGRSTLVFICIIVVTLIPIFGFIFTGTKLLFDIQQKFKRISIFMSIAWGLGICGLILSGIELGMNFRNDVEIDYEVEVPADSIDLLIVDVAEDDIFSNYIEYNHVWNYTELVKVKDEKVYLGYPELRIIEKPDSNNFEIRLYKESHGLYYKEAIRKAENIDYSIRTEQAKLELSPYFSIDREEKLRNQRIRIEIHVPQGKKIKFGENIDRILIDIVDDHYEHHHDTFANTTWFVEDEGIRCIECKERRRLYED
ncbi:MAG: PspC domain-containing protein [Crocinitomicaceae bacterium]